MIKKVIRMSVIAVCLLIIVAANFSCSSTSHVDELAVKTADVNVITSDLVSFGNTQQKLFDDFKACKDSVARMDNVKRLAMNVNEFMSTHDIYADLTAEERNSLKKNAEKHAVDMKTPSGFLNFAKANQSKEYYRLCNVLMGHDSIDNITIDCIANNKQLKLYEKMTLLVCLPAFKDVHKN